MEAVGRMQYCSKKRTAFSPDRHSVAAPFVNCIAKPRTFAVRDVKHKKMEEKMMVKAIMHGCNGKMGQVISNLVKEDDGIEIVAGIDKYTGVKNEYPVFTDIADCEK